MKLLLITADTALACALGARLSRTGYEIEHCTSGRAGLTRARQQAPELIVLDVMLPGMNGLTVLKWLRDVPWLHKVPVVLLIERTLERETLNECLFWGAAGYLEKDACPIQEMASGVETILRLSRPEAATALTPAGQLSGRTKRS